MTIILVIDTEPVFGTYDHHIGNCWPGTLLQESASDDQLWASELESFVVAAMERPAPRKQGEEMHDGWPVGRNLKDHMNHSQEGPSTSISGFWFQIPFRVYMVL